MRTATAAGNGRTLGLMVARHGLDWLITTHGARHRARALPARLAPLGIPVVHDEGAIDNVELGNLTGLLAKIKPAVKATTFKGEQSSKNAAFVDAVAQKNVELTMADIRKKSAVLAELESKGAIKIAGSMYNLETAIVDFFS